MLVDTNYFVKPNVVIGNGICQWGRCVVVGSRCEPYGFCPAHCAEFHGGLVKHPKAGELNLQPGILVIEEPI